MWLLRETILFRKKSILWWNAGIAFFVLATASAYLAIAEFADELDTFSDELGEGFAEIFGYAGMSMSTPVGYLMSQLYSSMFPLLIIIAACLFAAWTLAGREENGGLEIIVSLPISRKKIFLQNYFASVIVAFVYTFVTSLLLMAVSPLFKLTDGIPWWGILSAGIKMYALVMIFVSITMLTGALTGSRWLAFGMSLIVFFLFFVLSVFETLVDELSWLGSILPWSWFLSSELLLTGPGLVSTVAPLVISLMISAVATISFNKHELKN